MKKRIRRIIFLCILLTVMLFSGILMWAGANFLKIDTAFLSSYCSSYIAQSMNTDDFLQRMGIHSLKELKSGLPLVSWINEIKQNGGPDFEKMLNPGMTKPDIHAFIAGAGPKSDMAIKSGMVPGDPQIIIKNSDLFSLTIAVNDEVIYTDENIEKQNTLGYLNTFADKSLSKLYLSGLLEYYNVRTVANITDTDGNTVVRVYTKINDGLIIAIGMLFVTGVMFACGLALIAGFLISRFLSIPVVIPLLKLNERIRAIANQDSDTAMEAQIVLKRPLFEIESLAASTNSVLYKMRDFNEQLSAQNEELEAQNIELADSKRQIQEAQTQLVQNENMASVGQLTAAITHEINTPLGAINSNVQLNKMLLDKLMEMDAVKGDEELSNLMVQLQETTKVNIMACSRVTQIIRSLKNFSKIDQAEFQEADINEGLRSVLVLTSNLWKRNITIHEDYGSLKAVKCYSGMLNQVFMNIVVNAIQSIEDKGDIFIKTWDDDKYVYASIRDTGVGIIEENLPRIFDSGFTTKGNALGMGLGLSISHNIINKHNGEIKVLSKPGEGTEFLVSIMKL